jgi:hypothetical protein
VNTAPPAWLVTRPAPSPAAHAAVRACGQLLANATSRAPHDPGMGAGPGTCGRGSTVTPTTRRPVPFTTAGLAWDDGWRHYAHEDRT